MTGIICQDFNYFNREELLKAKTALMVEFGNRAMMSTIPLPDGSRKMIRDLSNKELLLSLIAIEQIEREITKNGHY